MKALFNLIQAILLVISLWLFASCNKFWGDDNLGNNISLLEGDHVQDRVVVYCTAKGIWGCSGGLPILPSKNNELASYVEVAKSDNRWVVAKVINKDQTTNYWILDKYFGINMENCSEDEFDRAVKSHTVGPLSFADFKQKLEVMNINLEIDERY